MIKFDPLSDVRRNLRVIVITSILLMLILLANAFISIYLLRKNSVQDRSDQLANLTIILAEHTAQTIFSANTALKSIRDSVEMAGVDTEKSYREFASKRSQFELLEDKTRSNTILDVSTFVASDGKVLNFSRSYPAPEINLSDRDYFKYLSVNNDLSTFYSIPVRNKGNGKWVFYLAQRINGKDGQFLGVVLVGVSVEVFSTLYERIAGNLGEGAAVTLYRKDKTLLTRWPLVADQIGHVNTNTFIDQSLAKTNGSGGVVFVSGPGFSRQNTEAIERMVSYREVKGYPFIVGAVIPESIYLANWYKNAVGVSIATIFSLIAIFIGSYFLFTTYRRDAENQYRAHHDALTELPNRMLFSDRLQQALAVSKRNNTKLALLFLDLDNLKTINDTYGHNAGDFLLKELAYRMKASIRDIDTVGRIGGDEFIVLLPGVDSELSATKIAEKILKTISAPLYFDGNNISGGVSIGIVIYPDHGQNETDLINNADATMYEAKANGGNQVKIYGNDVLRSAAINLT